MSRFSNIDPPKLTFILTSSGYILSLAFTLIISLLPDWMLNCQSLYIQAYQDIWCAY